MKFIVTTLLIALLSLVACIYLPWWSIAVTAFLVAVLIPQRSGIAFLSGFLALFLLWGLMAILINQANNQVLSVKLSQLFLHTSSSFALVSISAFLGGIIAGMGAITASFLRPPVLDPAIPPEGVAFDLVDQGT